MTATPSRTPIPTRTNTAGPATATATPPAATRHRDPSAPPPRRHRRRQRRRSATPTPEVPLGERIFTIREDSKFGDKEVRVGFFTSALSGAAVSAAFSPGPLDLIAGPTDANGIATLALKQDAYFKINIPAGGTVLCIRMLAAGSSGRIDCNGGSAFDVTVTAAAGQDAPPATVTTRLGTDAGPGAAELTVMQSIGEVAKFTDACDATVTFPEPNAVVYTTAKVTATKGARSLVKSGESFKCATWTTTDGDGMLVSGVAAFDGRAGGDSASATRLADK
ncbi:MAG: hypothetical protein U0802_26165 [Candidatus Binatia bacterium]